MDPAPALGDSNEYVLGELLGLERAEMDRLGAEGVIG
jgi:crotonobetainyl-CoA:carnitine CoA-transferase CaiB-like acyl-CoA transferase